MYIQLRSLHLNRDAEHFHAKIQEEFHQLVEYTDDINIKEKLQEWEIFYNCQRPHSAFDGQISSEVEKLKEGLL